jgi:alpha-amylase
LRPTLHLVCALHFHQPLGLGPSALDEAFEQYYDVLLDVLEEDPHLKLNLHFAGSILEHAVARRPDFVDRLKGLMKDERIEVLGGAFFDPVLPSIPDRDALSQLQFTVNFFHRTFFRVPKGAWLCLRAWDAGLLRLLTGAGVRYTLLDDAQFVVAGLTPGQIHGHFATERAGHSVSVFPVDASLVDAVARNDKPQLIATLESLARGSRSNGNGNAAGSGAAGGNPADSGLEVFAGDGEILMQDGHLADFLAALRSEHHWVKTHLMEEAWQQFPSRGRVYLPASARPDLADWCRPADAVARRRHFVRRMESAGAWDEAQHFLSGVVWDNFLVKYPEANQLHKRMLRVSDRVDQLRNLLAERQRSGRASDADTRARQALERACAALWRSQNHSAYWHGGPQNAGVYDPGLRQQTVRELLGAERIVDRVLGESGQKSITQADVDADGRDEIVLRTPHFSAIVHTGHGGTVWELDLCERSIPLQTSFSPVEEPYHERLAGNEVALVSDEEPLPAPSPASSGTHQVQAGTVPALASLALDRVPRGAFQDHFLAPETTLDSFARRQYRELGDFACEPYEVVKVAGSGSEEVGSVVVGRSGTVKDVGRTLLLRIEKTFRFDVGRPRLQLGHVLKNRSREPVSVWYGLEWTFGLPSGRPGDVRIRTLQDDMERFARLADGPADLGRQTWFEWQDPGADLAVIFELDRPMTLWWTPVTTVYQGPAGWVEAVQGHTLLLHAPLEVWGLEQQAFNLRVDFVAAS